MLPDVFELAFSDAVDLPAPEAADHILVRWLVRRLGREPSWLEVLALRAALRERERRRVWWAWWRRLMLPIPSRVENLVADFLRSPEGQGLYGLVGGMTALVIQLALPDPWEGYDGRHPHAQRPGRCETMRERVARGFAIPDRDRLRAVLAYAEWKLSGNPMQPPGIIPDSAGLVSPVHAAAINALSVSGVERCCARLRNVTGRPMARHRQLRELEDIGGEAISRWQGIEQRNPGPPLGVWPISPVAEPDGDNQPTLEQAPTRKAP